MLSKKLRRLAHRISTSDFMDDLNRQLEQMIPGAKWDKSMGDVILPDGRRVIFTRIGGEGGEMYYLVWKQGEAPGVDIKFTDLDQVTKDLGY